MSAASRASTSPQLVMSGSVSRKLRPANGEGSTAPGPVADAVRLSQAAVAAAAEKRLENSTAAGLVADAMRLSWVCAEAAVSQHLHDHGTKPSTHVNATCVHQGGGEKENRWTRKRWTRNRWTRKRWWAESDSPMRAGGLNVTHPCVLGGLSVTHPCVLGELSVTHPCVLVG